MSIFRISVSLLLSCLVGCQAVSVAERDTHRLTAESRPVAQAHVKSVDDWLAQLSSSDPLDRAWAAYQLGKLEERAAPAISALIVVLKDDSPVLLSRYVGGGFRSSNDTTPGDEAAQALIRIGHAAVPALINALSLPDVSSRRLAAKALGQIGEHEAIEPLLALLADPDRQVRAMAAIALGSFHSPQAAQIIADHLPNASVTSRVDMIYALGQIGEVIVVPALINQTTQQTAPVRAAVMHAFGRLRDGRAVPILLKGMHDPDERVRANAAYALGQFSHPQVFNALITGLDDPAQRVREAAQEALQGMAGVNLPPERAKWQAWWQQQQRDNLEPPTSPK